MLASRLLEERRRRLEQQLAAGQVPAAAEIDGYLTLAAFSIAMACELFKYEYGRLPQNELELLGEEYMDEWPADPQRAWVPLPLQVGSPFDPAAAGMSDEGIILAPAAGGVLAFDLSLRSAAGTLLLEYHSPQAVWLETEAQIAGSAYLAYEQELTRRYPDRSLWPFSRIVEPAAPLAGLPSPRQQAAAGS